LTCRFSLKVPNYPTHFEKRAQALRQERYHPGAYRRTILPCRLLGEGHRERFSRTDPTATVATEEHALNRAGRIWIKSERMAEGRAER
jgi:hypothetical protein